MPIFFVQLTLLLSLVARARGEWPAAIHQEEHFVLKDIWRLCARKKKEKKKEVALELVAPRLAANAHNRQGSFPKLC